jgi:hypothetical protein
MQHNGVEVVKSPYVLATSAAGGTIIAPGQQNVPQLQSDFSNSLEWPFLIKRIRFILDPAHTLRDARVRVVDQTYNQEWMKNPVMTEALVDVQTGYWELGEDGWVMRSQGGGQLWFVDNLDPANPIQITISLEGFLLIPSRGQ